MQLLVSWASKSDPNIGPNLRQVICTPILSFLRCPKNATGLPNRVLEFCCLNVELELEGILPSAMLDLEVKAHKVLKNCESSSPRMVLERMRDLCVDI